MLGRSRSTSSGAQLGRSTNTPLDPSPHDYAWWQAHREAAHTGGREHTALRAAIDRDHGTAGRGRLRTGEEADHRRDLGRRYPAGVVGVRLGRPVLRRVDYARQDGVAAHPVVAVFDGD